MKCPICNETSFIEWGKVQAYSILKCSGCGIGITAPFSAKEQLLELNKGIYEVEQRIRIYLSRQNEFKRRYDRYLKNIKKVKSHGKLLDIGCNIGFFIKAAQEVGFEVTGVELNDGCAAYGRKKFNLDIYSKYLEDISFSDETFDVITLFDVLEHVPDMHSFLEEVRRILKYNGLLVLQSPNFNSLMAELTKSKWHWLAPPDHLYHFTPETMIRFLLSHGFAIREIRTWEPAGDFSNNLMAAYPMNGFVGRVLHRLLRSTKIVFIAVLLLQRIWWKRGKGGLIEAYAIKTN